MRVDDANGGTAAVSGVGAQMLAAPERWLLPLDDERSQHRVKPGDVMDVGRGHDERQLDATTVHQQMTLAAIFFPDRSGSARPLVAPMEP